MKKSTEPGKEYVPITCPWCCEHVGDITTGLVNEEFDKCIHEMEGLKELEEFSPEACELLFGNSRDKAFTRVLWNIIRWHECK